MRVLVTGVCGLLGSHLLERLSLQHETVGTDRHPWWGDLPRPVIPGDLGDSAFLNKLIRDVRPEVLFHCAAMTDVDACEKDPKAADALNAELPGRLAALLPSDSQLIHLSTDAVFGGKHPRACEKDSPAPLNAYGRSKWEGEKRVLAERPDSLVIRTNFYGWSSGRKKTFAEWLWNALERQEPVTLFDDFFFSPIYVGHLSEHLVSLLGQGHRGLIHLAGKERVSKADFGAKMAEAAGLSLENVKRGSLQESGFSASRGGDLSLDSAFYRRLTHRELPSCVEGLRWFAEDRGKPLSRRFSAAAFSGARK